MMPDAVWIKNEFLSVNKQVFRLVFLSLLTNVLLSAAVIHQ